MIKHTLQGDFTAIIGKISNYNMLFSPFFSVILQAYFDAPEGTDPVALRMNVMQKGMIWVNGKSLGRYWVSFLSPLGQPTQAE